MPLESQVESETTTKATLEIEVERKETVSDVACKRCGTKGKYHRMEVRPPTGVGSTAYFFRVPDGWWIHGTTFLRPKVLCSTCFGGTPTGIVQIDPEDMDD